MDRVSHDVSLAFHQTQLLLNGFPDSLRHLLFPLQHDPEALAHTVVDEKGLDIVRAPRALCKRSFFQSLEETLNAPFGISFDFTKLGAVDVKGIADIHVPADPDRLARLLRERLSHLAHQRGQGDHILKPGFE